MFVTLSAIWWLYTLSIEFNTKYIELYKLKKELIEIIKKTKNYSYKKINKLQN